MHERTPLKSSMSPTQDGGWSRESTSAPVGLALASCLNASTLSIAVVFKYIQIYTYIYKPRS